MKTMTCRQLGGACDLEFTGETFEEVSAKSRKHGIEMYQAGDEAHLKAMKKMRELTKTPGAIEIWMDKKKKEFESLPEN